MNDAQLVWVVVEKSAAGEHVVGVFSDLGAARAVLPAELDTLERFRVEGHVLDTPREPRPWYVGLSRDGEVIETAAYVGCSCEDDEPQMRRLSYLKADGSAMHLIVTAPTPGAAIDAALRYREWLLERDLWGKGHIELEPIEAKA